MAHSHSAKKRIRQDEKKRIRNRARKSVIKTETKKYQAALASGNVAEAEKELKQVSKLLDRIGLKRTIHPNTAARKKSRLAKRLNALRAQAAPAAKA